MNKYHYILIAVLLVGCKSNISIADNVGIGATSSTQVKVSPTVEPSKESPPGVKINWQDTIEGTSLEWNGNDIFAQTKGGKKQGIFTRIARNYCHAEQTGSSKDCYCGHSIRLASVVGEIVSIDHESSFSCQGSYLRWRYASFDLGKSGDFIYPTFAEFNTGKPIRSIAGKMISLSALFPEGEILTALLANREIAKAISEAIAAKRMASPPQNLDEFNDYFAKFDSYISAGFFYLEKDYLTRFVFHHLDEDKVAVWISLTPTSHAGHANQEHIEIVLPIQEKLRKPLLLAYSGEQGFLMKDAPKYVGTSYAEFEFGSKEN